MCFVPYRGQINKYGPHFFHSSKWVALTSLGSLTKCETNVSKHEMRYFFLWNKFENGGKLGLFVCVYLVAEFDGAEIQEQNEY